MWTTDRTWTVAETVTASHLNVFLRAVEVSGSEATDEDEGTAATREDDDGDQ